MSDPLVSVVVSCFLGGSDAEFRARTLACTLASLRAQTYRNLEVMVAHNGPEVTDTNIRLCDVIDHATDYDARFDQWCTPENRGRFGHEWRMSAAERTKGDVIGLTNDDDVYANVYLERMVAHIQAGADLVLTSFVNGFTDRQVPGYPGYHAVPAAPVVGRCDVGSWLATRDLMLSTPWTDYGQTGDGVFVAAMAARAKKVAFEHRLLFMHN